MPQKQQFHLIVEIPGAAPRQFTLSEPALLLGRSGAADVVINSPVVSRQHARIIQIGNEYWLTDLGSTNGCSVNGKRVSTIQLNDGDTILFGGSSGQPVKLTVRIDALSAMRIMPQRSAYYVN